MNICITGPQWVIPREVHVLAVELSILITYLVVHTIKWGLWLHVCPYYIPWNMHADCCAVLLWFYYQSQIVWEWFTHILEGCSHGQLCDCLSAHEVILKDMGKIVSKHLLEWVCLITHRPQLVLSIIKSVCLITYIASPTHQTPAILSSTPEPGVHPSLAWSQPSLLQLLRGLQRFPRNNGEMALISNPLLMGLQRLPKNNDNDKLDGWGWGQNQIQHEYPVGYQFWGSMDWHCVLHYAELNWSCQSISGYVW